MNKFLLVLLLGCVASLGGVNAQTLFPQDIEIPAGFAPTTVLLPPSPLSMQVLFVGGVDLVETTATYGNPAGQQFAKEWHDFIGFTPDETGASLGWVSVNHEMIYRDDRLGDGGGMSVFRVKRDPITGLLEVMNQQLEDGRSGKFFNVDFVNTVGETGMNCAGISSIVDGRIWTAEEWFRSNNSSINNGNTSTSSFPVRVGGNPNQGVRDTADFTIESDIPGFDGLTVKKYQNFNWMVEIDPRQAVAIRKQYNWGRQGFEGGVIAADNRTVYLGVDDTPGFFTRFIADVPGDFTRGTTYIYKHDAPGGWVEIDNSDPAKMLDFKAQAVAAGGTMYDRIEWVAIDPQSGLVYWTETGADNPGNSWADEFANGAVHDPYHIQRAQEQGVSSPNDPAYWDYFGRVWVYDPNTNYNSVLIEGGPYFASSPAEADYPSKHLSNPDGLNVMVIDGQSFLIIQEDLNGASFGRLPAGATGAVCEMYLLNLATPNPTVDDLIRLTATPIGAEITGCAPTPDGRSLLVNSQHPRTNHPFPFNHSLTFAIHGFDELTVTDLEEPNFPEGDNTFRIFPNPTTRTVYLSSVQDIALYNVNGQRLQVYRGVNQIDVSQLAAGFYFLMNQAGEIQKLVVE